MKNEHRQLNIFTEQDFRPKHSEQPSNPQPNLSWKDYFDHTRMDIDCFYYLCAGNCVMHGDTSGCMDCQDYKSINEDDNDQDDD